MKKSLFVLFTILLFVSCNVHIEKRLYRKGYYVEVAKNIHHRMHNRENAYLNHSEMATNTKLLNKISIPTESPLPAIQVIPDEFAFASAKMDEEELAIYRAPILINTYTSNKTAPNIQQEKFTSIAPVEKNTISSQLTNGDTSLYLLAALMAAVVFGVFKLSQRLSLNISRWATKHKTVAKIIMTLMHVKIGVMGVLTGKELFEMGYSFSNSLEYVFGGMMVAPFLYLLLSKSKDEVMVLRSFYLRKLSLLGLVLPFYMLTIGIGNKLGDHRTQISPLGFMVEKTYDAFTEKRVSTFNEIPAIKAKKYSIKETEFNKMPDGLSDGCDIITMADNTTMEVLVQSVNEKEVRYKKCNNPNGPTFVTSSKKVSKIVKSNGDVIEPSKLVNNTNNKSTGWPGWYVAVYIIMTLVLVCAIIVSWLFLSYTPAAPIAITAVCLALIIAVPFLMQRRVNLGNIKRKEKKNKK